MIKKIRNTLCRIINNYEISVFKKVLKKYNVKFYFKDKMNILSKRDWTDNFNYIFKTHNSCDAIPLMEKLDNKIKNSKICFDIGANIGMTSLWMAKHANEVYAFEPERNNISRLKENIEVNKVKNIKCIPAAISDKSGKAELNVFEGYGHHSLGRVNTSSFINIEIVDVITLDYFCSANNIKLIDFIKIDVEGFEYEVLNGCRNMLREHRIKLLCLEISKRLLLQLNKDAYLIYDILNQYDYKIYNLDGKRITRNQIGQIEQEDVFAEL